jgi:hypothetical protein
MSKKPDIEEVVMSFEEKMTWVSGFVSVLVTGVYFWIVLGRVGSVPVGEIAYQVPMLIAMGAMVVMSIVGAILMSIGTAVSAEITGVGSVKDIDRKDERDVHIAQRGDLIGYYVTSAGVLGALALAMLKSDQFWIANAIFAGFMVSSVVGSAYKVFLYRRGF